MAGLESEDLVSFANSKRGGAILIGVDEAKDGTGRQTAVVVGCPIGDGEKLKILSKSNQCSPPVQVSIFLENSEGQPFYRIEIPSGPHKPYCTSGTYKTRGDGRKETLHPPQLLALFLETEGGEFLRRFQEATTNLETAVRETKERISEELKELNESVQYTESSIQESLQGIDATASAAQDNADEAKAFSEDAMHIIDAVHSMVEDLSSGDPEMAAISQKLDALLERFEIEDPAITNYRRYVKALTLALTERSTRNGKPDDRKWITDTVTTHMPKGVNRRMVTGWVNEAIDDPKAAKDDAARLPASDASFVPMIAASALRNRATADGSKRRSTYQRKTKTAAKPVTKLKRSPR